MKKEIYQKFQVVIRKLKSKIKNFDFNKGKLSLPFKINIKGHGFDIFDVNLRKTFHLIFFFLFVVIFFYNIGKLLGLTLSLFESPKTISRISIPTYGFEEIVKDLRMTRNSNIFLARLTSEEIKKGQKAPVILTEKLCSKSDIKSTIPVKVKDTIVMQNGLKSLAFVKVTGQKEDLSVREEEKISTYAKIGKIERLKIIFRNLNSGKCEYIVNKEKLAGKNNFSILSPSEGKKFIDGKKGITGIENDGNSYRISREFFEKKMEDIDSILTQARAVQIRNPDGTLSFKILDIIPGSLFSYLGIENNDKITRINGKKISGLNEVINLFGSIQDLSNLELTVEKNDGIAKDMDYSFTK